MMRKEALWVKFWITIVLFLISHKKAHFFFREIENYKKKCNFQVNEKKKLVLVFFNKIGSLSVLDFESRDLTKVLYFVVTKLIGSQFPKVIVSFCKG